MRSLPLPIRRGRHLSRWLLRRRPLVMRSFTRGLGEGGSGRRRGIAVGVEIVNKDQDWGVTVGCTGT